MPLAWAFSFYKGRKMKEIEVLMDGNPYKVTRLLTHERSNAKLRKSAGGEWLLFGLSMSPATTSGHQVCSSSTPGCRKACIFTSGNGGYPIVSRGRKGRALAWFQKREEFKKKLYEEMELAMKLAKRHKRNLGIRLNVFSDIMWERQFPEIIGDFGEVQFYDYTKHFERMMRFCRGEFPSNYYLTFSRSEKNEEECLRVLSSGRNVSVPFTINAAMKPDIKVPLPNTYLGYPVVNGENNDLRFLDPQGCVVGVKTKGMGFWDKTGFVVDMMGSMPQEAHHVSRKEANAA